MNVIRFFHLDCGDWVCALTTVDGYHAFGYGETRLGAYTEARFRRARHQRQASVYRCPF